MQGDLGQNQPEVKAAFRRALVAHNVAEEKISSLMQRVSAPVARNPLSEADTKLVNNALDAPEGHLLVDAMDEQIFADVCRQLVFRIIQKIHDCARMCNTGPWLGGWRPWHNKYAWF